MIQYCGNYTETTLTYFMSIIIYKYAGLGHFLLFPGEIINLATVYIEISLLINFLAILIIERRSNLVILWILVHG